MLHTPTTVLMESDFFLASHRSKMAAKPTIPTTILLDTMRVGAAPTSAGSFFSASASDADVVKRFTLPTGIGCPSAISPVTTCGKHMVRL
jgi:hypothetical protein